MITVTWLKPMWNSVESLSSIVIKANWGIAATLLLGCVCTAVSIVAGNRKDELLKATELEKEQQIADTNHLAAVANERSKKLEVTAEQARTEQKVLESKIESQRTENLRLQAHVEQAQLENLKLQTRVASRRLTQQQKDKLKASLSRFPSQSVKVAVFIGTDDGMPFSIDLVEAISAAGWKAEHTGQTTFGGDVRGLALLVKDTSHAPLVAKMLQDAFQEIGMEAQGVNDPSMEPNAVVIFIAPKIL